VIFLTLTGIRISELASICAEDYEQKNDGTWVFKSSLIKTNMGLMEVRSMSGLVAEAADILCKISYVTKKGRTDSKRLPLFGVYFLAWDLNTDNDIRDVARGEKESSLRGHLNGYYKKFIDKYGQAFEDMCPSVHPHRFRHSWAEFALRRFEGDVFEAIRVHFRHSYNSQFTHRYTDGKLSEEIKSDIERKYLRELIERMAGDDKDDEFVGATALYIKRFVNSDEFKCLEPSEVDGYIDDLCDEFESLIAHEYGFCLVRKETRNQAKCLDKTTGIPILENGSFELCSGCINSLHSCKSNKESITRIATSHQNMIASFPFTDSTAVKESKATLTRASKILSQMQEVS
jgi:hypothetical protein